MTRPILCFVTDRHRCSGAPLLDRIAAAAHAGVDMVQIREPDLPGRELYELVRAAVLAVAGTPARIVVNERTDVAIAAGAAGAHLKGSSPLPSVVRRLAPRPFLIGRSVHAADEAAAVEHDCDYLLFGTVFPSEGKPPGHPVAGIDGLRVVCSRVTVPVLAIGGVTEDRAAAVGAAGGSGLAGIGLFSGTADVQRLVAALRQRFDTGGEVV